MQGEGTSRAVKLARLVNAPLYVVHVNSRDAALEIEAGREAGQRVWGEALAGGIALTDEPWWVLGPQSAPASFHHGCHGSADLTELVECLKSVCQGGGCVDMCQRQACLAAKPVMTD